MPKTISKKINLRDIQTELELVRSFMIGFALKDKEGEYKPEFVKRMKKLVREKSTHTFTNTKDFLRQIRKS